MNFVCCKTNSLTFLRLRLLLFSFEFVFCSLLCFFGFAFVCSVFCSFDWLFFFCLGLLVSFPAHTGHFGTIIFTAVYSFTQNRTQGQFGLI